MAVNFQDEDKSGTEKVARNPNNFNILKGGKVDPRSPLYQRSVAGREQLKDYLNRLWNQGGDEADVFMAGVKSLMNRGHGYVGAYLDSKNPGRRYTDNQAKAIVDQVMTDEGIGEHPGARLTRPKAEDDSPEAKEKAKQAKATRKEANVARGSGPQQAPGQKAMPVGQQRKQGKRESTGQPLEDSQRPGREGGAEGSRAVKEDASKYRQPVKTGTGETEFYNVDKVRGVLEDWKKGEASTEDVLAEFQKTYQKPLSDSPQAVAERRQKRAESRDRYYTTGSGKMPDGEKKPPAGGGAKAPAGAGQPPSSESAAPEKQEGFVPDKDIQDLFKDLIRDTKDINKKSIEDIITEISQTLQEDQGVEISDADVQRSIRKVDGYSRFLDKYGIESSAPSEQPAAAPAPAAAPQPETAPDRQAQATDEDVMRRATLLGGKKPQAVPEEQAQPAPSPNRATRRAQGQRGSGSRARKTQGTAPRGFGGPRSVTPEQKQEIMQAAAQSQSVEDFKSYLYNNQPDLFGGAGFETGSASTNPLEDTPPDPYEKFRGTPAPKQVGAQAGGRELPTAGRGEEGQGSLLKRGTMEARGDFKKGAKPIPSKGAAPGEQTPSEDQASGTGKPVQGNLFGGRGFNTGSAATNPLEDSPADPYERFRGSPAPKPTSAQAGGREPGTVGKGQEGQQGLFKRRGGQETLEPRGDLKKGSKTQATPKPPAAKKRTQAESQEIRKQGSEALADIQTRNKLAEDMTRRISNSPVAKNEEMRDWINNDLERLLKSFTPAEKTEDPWEQDGPEPSNIPEPKAPAAQPQRSLPGQPGPRGLLSSGKEPAAPREEGKPPSGGRTRAQNESKAPARRTKAEGDEIRRSGQEALEQIQSDARREKELQQRMADSPAGSGEVPGSRREAEITRRGEEALRPKAKKPIRDAVARALIGKGGSRLKKGTVNSAEYQEFAQSIRSMMR